MILLILVAISFVSCATPELYPYEGLRDHARLDAYRHSDVQSLRAQAAAFDNALEDQASTRCHHCNGHGYTHCIAHDTRSNRMVVAAEECNQCRGLGVIRIQTIHL